MPRSKYEWLLYLVSCLLLLLIFAAATAQSRAATYGASENAEKHRYNSVWDYCKAVVRKTSVTEQRWGPSPAERKRFLRVARSKFLSEDAPESLLVGGLSVRCMAGEVWACHVGANLPCWAKADTSREPAAALRDFCRESPGARVIPMVVTGRETIFSWVCKGTTPVTERTTSKVDPDGFIADIWTRVERP